MRYQITIQFDPDTLLQKFADSQGIPISEVEEDIETILTGEISTALDDSRIYILNLEEV